MTNLFKHVENFTTSEGYWHSSDCIAIGQDILHITQAKTMLEIGFNIGYSAAIWLSNGVQKLYVIDINNHKDTESALKATKTHFSDKEVYWWLISSTSEDAKAIQFDKLDAAFIDGAHDFDAVISDIQLSIDAGADWLIFDDVHYESVNTVYPAIKTYIDSNKIIVEKEYAMTWYGIGKVLLCKVVK